MNDLIQEAESGEEADVPYEESAPNVEEPTEPVSEETGSSDGEGVSGEDAPAEDVPQRTLRRGRSRRGRFG